MSFLNNEDEEARSDASKPRSNPSRLPSKARSKENSLELHRWHSFKDELIKESKDHSYSSHMQKNSLETSEPKVNSLILADRSNSEVRANSVASKYVEYLESIKRYMHDPKRPVDPEDLQKSKAKDNILLNSTILSNCFIDRSFQGPINELSNEAEFIEEKSSDGSDQEVEEEGDFFSDNPREGHFFSDNQREGLSNIYNNLERESFSFDNDNKRLFSGILEDIQTETPQVEPQNAEDSFDSLDNIDRIGLDHFFEKAKSPNFVTEHNKNDQFIKITVQPFGDNALPVEFVLTRKGLVHSKRNTKCGSLVLGRASTQRDEVVPCDIIFPVSEKGISRVHCSIIYKNLFTPRKIPRAFVALLSGRKKSKDGRPTPLSRLGQAMFERIFSFLCPASKLYAVDLASASGTFRRLTEKTEIKKGDIYMIGHGFNLRVSYLSNRWSSNSNIKDLYKFLADEPEDKTAIHGLSSEQMRKVELLREKKRSVIKEILKEQENDSFFYENVREDAEPSFPILILEVENPSSTIKPIQ